MMALEPVPGRSDVFPFPLPSLFFILLLLLLFHLPPIFFFCSANQQRTHHSRSFTNTLTTATMKFITALALPLLALPFARASITPTSPDGSTVVKVGDTIEALWNVDSTGGWTDVEIQLMTGSNLAVCS